MFGTYRINQRKESAARLSLGFENAELNFYTCSLKGIDGELKVSYNWYIDVIHTTAQAVRNKGIHDFSLFSADCRSYSVPEQDSGRLIFGRNT